MPPIRFIHAEDPVMIRQPEPVEPEPIRAASGEVFEQRSIATFACEHPGVTAAMNYLRENHRKAIYVQEIARAVGISARSLQMTFKAVVGCTLSDEIARLRLTHAAQLLRETDLNLRCVAQQSGLSTAKYLCEVFRRAFQTTPAAYREAHRAARPASQETFGSCAKVESDCAKVESRSVALFPINTR